MDRISGGGEGAFGIPAVIFLAAAYIGYETLATLMYMPYFALTPELSLDYAERTDLTTYRIFFSILARLVGFMVPFLIIDQVNPTSAPTILLIGISFRIASALPLLVTFFGMQERKEFLQPDLCFHHVYFPVFLGGGKPGAIDATLLRKIPIGERISV